MNTTLTSTDRVSAVETSGLKSPPTVDKVKKIQGDNKATIIVVNKTSYKGKDGDAQTTMASTSGKWFYLRLPFDSPTYLIHPHRK